jgi:hypothetical protein
MLKWEVDEAPRKCAYGEAQPAGTSPPNVRNRMCAVAMHTVRDDHRNSAADVRCMAPGLKRKAV